MKYLLPFIIFLLPLTVVAQDCTAVKTGEYITTDEETGGTVLKRTTTTQEEIADALGVHMKYDLIWTSECSYALYNGTVVKGDSKYLGKKTDTLFVEITNVNLNGYDFISTANFADFEMTGTVNRIK